MPTKTDAPLLSFVIPHYNHKDSLPELLDSVLQQSLKSLEVVVVDNCSTESCLDVIEAYRNKGLLINFIQHETNRGIKESRLTGIENAKGRCLTFADADDRLYGTNSLAYHAELMVKNNADIVHFNSLIYPVSTTEQRLFLFGAPIAAYLEGNAVFDSYVEAGLRAHTMWGKLYARELCMKHFDICRAHKVRWAHEDFYLTTWFFFHAKKYIGSEHVGYFHNFSYEEKKHKLCIGRMMDDYTMLHEMLPFFHQQCNRKDTLEKCKKRILWFFLREAFLFCELCYSDTSPKINQHVFTSLMKEYPSLGGIIEYALAQAPSNWREIEPRLKGCLAELRKAD